MTKYKSRKGCSVLCSFKFYHERPERHPSPTLSVSQAILFGSKVLLSDAGVFIGQAARVSETNHPPSHH